MGPMSWSICELLRDKVNEEKRELKKWREKTERSEKEKKGKVRKRRDRARRKDRKMEERKIETDGEKRKIHGGKEKLR